MSEISTNIILDGITLALRAAYPNSKISANKVEQGLRQPAFIVRLVSAGQTARRKNRWRRTPRFDIIFFPHKAREECYTVADELCGVLELIGLPGGDKLRGTDMSFEVEDDVLHFFVSYNHFVVAPENETKMEDFIIEQGLSLIHI